MARFRSDWKMTTFVVLMLPVVVALGFWQLERADYKRGLEDAYFDQLGSLAVPLPTEQPDDFSRVKVAGHYRDPHYLLDNQIKDGKPGYWVLTPFETTTAGVVLVNRGWVAQGATRADLPELPPTPIGETMLKAMVWPDTGLLPLFGAGPLERLTPPWVRLQRLDWELLVPLYKSHVEQHIEQRPGRQSALRAVELRLEAGQPGVLKPAPQTIQFGIARHVGYAVQWFGLAIALVICFIVYGRRRT